MTREEIIQELNLLKERIGKLEEALENMDKKGPPTEEFSADRIFHGGERGLRDRQEALEKNMQKKDSDVREEVELTEDISEEDEVLHGGERGIQDRWQALEKSIEGIDLSGAVEVEAFYEKYEPKEGRDESRSDLVLETVELAVDAAITDQMRGHILFDYQEGDGVDIDEAIIHFRAKEVCVPDLSCHSFWYASIGKMNVPFGYYESHFISDPSTLELGETKETALVIGAHRSFFNLAAGIFNGDIDESGGDDHIEDFVGVGFLTLPENIVPELSVVGGVSYISNIADSDELTEYINEEFGSDTIADHVDGAGVFLSISYKERYFLEAEWVGALEAFKEDRNFKPEAWNLELAFRPLETLEFALRYGRSEDSLDFLPETQWGVAAIYELFDNVSLGLEYKFDEYENDDEVTTLTTQFAVEFD